MQSRGRLITFALLAVCAQVLRNWLMLHAIGVHVSIFDSMALLIVMFTVGQLPIGPSTGPAATVLILGAHGVAAAAAAGVLVTLTGIIGSLIFAAWAAIDSIANRRRGVAAPPVVTVGPDAARRCAADVALHVPGYSFVQSNPSTSGHLGSGQLGRGSVRRERLCICNRWFRRHQPAPCIRQCSRTFGVGPGGWEGR